MALAIAFLLICLSLGANSDPQLNPSLATPFQYSSYLRSAISMPNKEKEAPFEGRLLFGDITITIGTSTLTTTLTDTSTCSTSTAGLSVCVASGRRRKAVSDDKLFYLSDDGDHFLPSGELPESKTRSERSEISETLKDEQKPTPAFVLPLVVEPGFGGPYRQARFFVAFTTTTTTTRTTSTAIVSVTAICSSFTTWQVCGASGK